MCEDDFLPSTSMSGFYSMIEKSLFNESELGLIDHLIARSGDKDQGSLHTKGINRFCVMATLQAARAYLLGLRMDEAYSWGLNRSIFYAAAKRGFKGVPQKGMWYAGKG